MPEASLACQVCSTRLPFDARACPSCGAVVSEPGGGDPPSTATPSQRRPVSVVERRQTTVLFCDLVDSTALSGSLDPEDLREVLHAFRDAAQRVIDEHTGFLASYMGDGVLAFFGYPRAEEDDAQRAVRAGLELTRVIGSLSTRHRVSLHSRVGIATGVVVVGPLTSGSSLEDVAVGQTTNLAARLQSLASPDSVVISEVTMQLVRGSFESRALGAQTMKGFERPVPAFQVVRERAEQDTIVPAVPPTPTSPLVGREQELRLLSECWQSACQGKGRLVILQGEPGVGKSRLVLELRRVAAAASHELLRYSCAPRFQNSTLFPVIRQLERATGILPDDGPEQKLDKIEAYVGRTAHDDDDPDLVRVLAALLSVPFGTRYQPIGESAERLKRRTFQALKHRVYAAARAGPVLLIVEDIHWADPTTIELLNEVLEGVTERPVLVVTTVRPGFGGEWPKCSETTLLDLPRLSGELARAMVAGIAGERALPGDMAAHVLRKSEGVPLFIEELTRTALNVLEAEDAAPSSQGLPAIPSTLQDSLAARLDRLSSVKEVAQVAAVIGREFGRDLLREVLSMPEEELEVAIDALVAADLIRRQDAEQGLCSFKHVLLQDAAYEMMLRSTRRDLHERICHVFERRRAGSRIVAPDILAHHWAEAGEPIRAIPYLEEAGQSASARAAHTEARRHFQRGLELVAPLPPSTTRDEHELRLSVGIGLAASATQGYAAPEVEAAYQRALELCRTLGNHAGLFPALRGLCTFYIVRAALETARDLGEECLRVAEASGDPADLIESATALGYTRVYQGALAEGQAHLGRAIERYRANQGEQLSYPSLQDPAVASLCLQAIVAFMVGSVRDAERLQVEALELAERLGRPFNRAYAHSFASLHGNLRGDFAGAAEHADRAVAIAEQHGFPVWQGAATMHGSIARGNGGDPEGAIPVLGYMLGLWQAGGAELNRPFFLLGLASCQRAAGRDVDAQKTLDEAFEQARRSGEAFVLSEQHRLRAEILHALAPADESAWRQEFARAAAVANEQGALLLELRAVCALLSRDRQAAGALERASEIVRMFQAAGEDHEELRRDAALLAGPAA